MSALQEAKSTVSVVKPWAGLPPAHAREAAGGAGAEVEAVGTADAVGDATDEAERAADAVADEMDEAEAECGADAVVDTAGFAEASATGEDENAASAGREPLLERQPTRPAARRGNRHLTATCARHGPGPVRRRPIRFGKLAFSTRNVIGEQSPGVYAVVAVEQRNVAIPHDGRGLACDCATLDTISARVLT